MPNPDGTPTDEEAIKAAIEAGTKSKTVTQPIGVPYYITDPATGQPVVGPDGQPLRWGAQTQSGIHVERQRGLDPDEMQRSISTPTYDYQLPRYFDGDQWLPAQLPPDQLAMLQRKMVSAGLLKTGQAQLGVWDAASMRAYTELLGFANAGGLDVSSALDRWGQAHTSDPNAGKPVLQTSVSNPDDLRAVFRKAVIDTRGEGWDTAKIDQMVAAYQGVERGAQTASYNASETGALGAPPVAAPSPQTFAETQVRKEDPLGAQEHDTLGMLNSFKQMIGGWQ